MSFLIHALSRQDFEPLFTMSDEELAARKALRIRVDTCPGTPCRVSLEDAREGEEVIAINHQHQSASTIYQASHAIFIRENASQANPAVNEIPELFNHRLISLRGFDSDHMLVDAEAVQGTELKQAITDLFQSPQVDYLHLHYAKPGCFAARVTRA